MFRPEDEEDPELSQELGLLGELKNYAKDGQANEMTRELGRESVDDEESPMMEDVPGVDDGEMGAGDDPLKDIDPETLKLLLAKLQGGSLGV